MGISIVPSHQLTISINCTLVLPALLFRLLGYRSPSLFSEAAVAGLAVPWETNWDLLSEKGGRDCRSESGEIADGELCEVRTELAAHS